MIVRSIGISFIFLITLTLCSGFLLFGRDDSQEALRLYRENKLDQALPLFQHEIEKDSNNADMFAWLAETYRRLNQPQKAVQAARRALALNSRHSFAHTTLADTYNPLHGVWEQANYDTTWRHLLLAVECDSNDGNAWLGVWIEAMRRGEDALWKNALRSMVRTKFITPPFIAYNRWVLNNLPKDALLLTNGDMDTFPAVALQVVEGFRTDVAIVNIPLLNTSWYPRFISRQYHVTLPFRDWEIDSLKPMQDSEKTIVTISNQIVQGWFKQKEEHRLSIPLAIASTVDFNALPEVEGHLKLIGPYSLWLPQKSDSPCDTALMRMSIASIHPQDFTESFVSPQDRSPIRITYSNGTARTVVWAVLYYTDLLIQAKRFSEASQALNVAEEIDKNCIAGRMYREQISNLRESLSH